MCLKRYVQACQLATIIIIPKFLKFVTIETCPPFTIRASNQTYQTTQGFYSVIEANIEVCIDGSYVAICDESWDDVEAQLACNELGYNKPFYRMFHHML